MRILILGLQKFSCAKVWSKSRLKISLLPLLTVSFVFFCSTNVFADLIQGEWKYIAYIYQGQRAPLPNPNLDLRFTFDGSGLSKLKWTRANEDGFCERLAEYSIEEGNLLRQFVTWVNPDNHISCSSDTDMRLGSLSFTPFLIFENELQLRLEINGEPFFYVLKRISPETISP